MKGLKTILWMILSLVIGLVLASFAIIVTMLLGWSDYPLRIYGTNINMLQSSHQLLTLPRSIFEVQTLWFTRLMYTFGIPVFLGTIYGLERLWRRKHRDAYIPQGILMRLGAIIVGLIIALWIHSVYIVITILSIPTQYLTKPNLYQR
jgi:hypothetical protein